MPFWLPNGTTLLRPDRNTRSASSCASAATRRSRRRRCSTRSSGTAPATGTTTRTTCTSWSDDDRRYALRPMNCPGACLVYAADRHSYRELPLRLAEFGRVSRNEREGVLHGLLRVRAFTQDDAHVYCTEDQIDDEVGEHLRGDRRALRPLRLRGREGRALDPAGEVDGQRGAVGRRPRRRWPRRSTSQGREYELNPGDGAFYGPKIDFHVTDALGRSWQCGTCQLDFQMPERFELDYTGADDDAAAAGDDPPRPARLDGALRRDPDRALRRPLPGLAGAGAGDRPADLRPPQRVRASRRWSSCARPACGSRSTTARSRSARRSATPRLGRYPYMLVVGDREQETGGGRRPLARRGRTGGDVDWPSSPPASRPRRRRVSAALQVALCPLYSGQLDCRHAKSPPSLSHLCLLSVRSSS